MHRSVRMPAEPISIHVSCALFVRDYGQMIWGLRYRCKFCHSSDLKSGNDSYLPPSPGEHFTSACSDCSMWRGDRDLSSQNRFYQVTNPWQDRTSQDPPLQHPEPRWELCKLHIARKVKPNFMAEYLHLIYICLLNDRFFPLSFKNESFWEEDQWIY